MPTTPWLESASTISSCLPSKRCYRRDCAYELYLIVAVKTPLCIRWRLSTVFHVFSMTARRMQRIPRMRPAVYRASLSSASLFHQLRQENVNQSSSEVHAHLVPSRAKVWTLHRARGLRRISVVVSCECGAGHFQPSARIFNTGLNDHSLIHHNTTNIAFHPKLRQLEVLSALHTKGSHGILCPVIRIFEATDKDELFDIVQ